MRTVITGALALLLGAAGYIHTVETPATAWFDVPWSGGHVRVALIPPAEDTSAPHPVIFALPWGAGSEGLVESFLGRYWSRLPGLQGYYVVSPAVRGSTLADTADELIPAIFDWMDDELDYDPSKVALVGASNGGGGMFHAALAHPRSLRYLVGAARTVRRGLRGTVCLGRKARLVDGRRV